MVDLQLTKIGSSLDDTQEREHSLSRVVALMQHNKPQLAEKRCRKFLQDFPGCVDHLRMLGHSLLKQDRSEEAAEQIRFAISLSPAFAPLHEDLGGILAAQGNLDEAIETFEKAVQLDPTRPNAHKKLGQVLAATGRGQEADIAEVLAK